jgi:hypothetical protein
MKYIILSHKGIRLKKDRVLPHGSKVDAEDLQDLNIEFLLAGGFIGIEKTTSKKMEDND